jgi:hypothetical protein
MSVDILVIFVAGDKYFKILLIETVLLFLAVSRYNNGGIFSLSILKEVVINLFLAVDSSRFGYNCKSLPSNLD